MERRVHGTATARQRGIDMERLLHDGTGCCICASWHRHATLGHQIHLLHDRPEPPSPPVQLRVNQSALFSLAVSQSFVIYAPSPGGGGGSDRQCVWGRGVEDVAEPTRIQVLGY